MRYFPRRSSPFTFFPAKPRRTSIADPSHTTLASRIVTLVKLCPTSQGASSFLMVSTSGSSGISSHLSPVFAQLYIYLDRDAKLEGMGHTLTNERLHFPPFTLGHLKEQLVVYLQQHLALEIPFLHLPV